MQTGEIVAGRFAIVGLAQKGGMSEVYRAKDLQTNETVAVKILLESLPQEADRFLLEAKALSALQHPHIVRYIAHGVLPDDRAFLALEWLEGEDLSDRLSRQLLSLKESLTLCEGVAEALAFAHSQGITHRDIKPPNIFLPKGFLREAKLLDFGIARLKDSVQLTQTGAIIGTPGYMAPEQASQGAVQVGPAADIFSLGCVLFECITGQMAFSGDTVMAILAKILFAEPPLIRALCPEVSEEVASLVHSMLQKDPLARPKDGAALVSLLRNLRAPNPQPQPIEPELPSAITASEQRLFCAIVTRPLPEAAGPVSEEAQTSIQSAPDVNALREIVARYGARFEALSDGTLIIALFGAGVASDQALKTARCALALQPFLPGAPMALAMGFSEVGRLTISEVIDRSTRLLAPSLQPSKEPKSLTPRLARAPIYLDETIASLLDNRFEISQREGSFVLVSVEERNEQRRTLLGRPSPLIGRERELSSLQAAIEDAMQSGSPRASIITASAGGGKSRLCYELLQRLRGQDIEIWLARGDPLRASAPFGLLSQIIRKAASLQEGEPPSVKQKKLSSHVLRVMSSKRPPASPGPSSLLRFASTPQPQTNEAQKTAIFLGEICGVSFPEQSPELRAARQDPKVMGDQMRRAFLDWLSAQCQVRPVLFVLDDVQWGDLPTLNFFDAALGALREAPFFVLALGRPEMHELFPGLWQRREVESTHLSALSRRSSEQLAKNLLGESTEGLDRIVTQAEGNPFYLEELCRAAVQGSLKELPKSILAMASARLEALPKDARRVLRACSIFGQSFWPGGVARLLGESSASSLSRSLESLCREDVILRQGEGRFVGEEEFSFRQPLLREAAYSTLTEEDKKVGHTLAASWLVAAGESNALTLAEHFERGQEPKRALEFYARAAAQALDANDLEAVLQHSQKALSFGPSDEQRGDLRLLQSEAYVWKSDHTTAEALALEAMSALPTFSSRWYEAASRILTISTHLGHYDQLVSLIETLQQTPREEARAAYVADTSRLIPYLGFAGMYDLAGLFIEKLTAAAAPLQEEDPLVRAWLFLGKGFQSSLLLGDPWGFYQANQEAARSFLQVGDHRNALIAILNIGVGAKALGRYDEAAHYLRQTITESEQLGLELVTASARHYLILVLGLQGAHGEELDREKQIVEAFVGKNNDPLAGTSRHSLAALYFLLGDLERAEREARASAEVLWVAPPGRAHVVALLSEIVRAQGKKEEALSLAQEATESLFTLGAIGEGEAQVMLSYIEALFALQKTKEAQKMLSRAKDRLMVRANKITDPEYRESFLKNVSENKRLLGLQIP